MRTMQHHSSTIGAATAGSSLEEECFGIGARPCPVGFGGEVGGWVVSRGPARCGCGGSRSRGRTPRRCDPPHPSRTVCTRYLGLPDRDESGRPCSGTLGGGTDRGCALRMAPTARPRLVLSRGWSIMWVLGVAVEGRAG